MNPGWEQEVLAALGEDGVTRLVAAFYRRVPADDLLGPMYRESLADGGEDMAQAEERLRDFMLMRLGASNRYLEQRGHPRLRARHVRFAIDRAGAERWVRLMDEAMAETGVPAPIAAKLRPFFEATAAWMVTR